jgi:hypothetical protein
VKHNRHDAQYSLVCLLRDLALSEGNHYNARAVREQLEAAFGLENSKFTEAQFYAIRGLVERCVCRALNCNMGLPWCEIERRVQDTIRGYDAAAVVECPDPQAALESLEAARREHGAGPF